MTAYKYGFPGPIEPLPVYWELRAKADLINKGFPDDLPSIALNKHEEDFLLTTRSRVEGSAENKEWASRQIAPYKQVKFVNLEAMVLAREQLTALRDRINSLLDQPPKAP